jgi:hypothetical protein
MHDLVMIALGLVLGLAARPIRLAWGVRAPFVSRHWTEGD